MTNNNLIPATAAFKIIPTESYAAFVKAFNSYTQVGIVLGSTALEMLRNSEAPDTLFFSHLD